MLNLKTIQVYSSALAKTLKTQYKKCFNKYKLLQ